MFFFFGFVSLVILKAFFFLSGGIRAFFSDFFEFSKKFFWEREVLW